MGTEYDLGYPSTVELSDGSLITVFYAMPENNKPAVIMQQKWKFEDDNITAIKWTSSNYYEMIKLKDLTHGEMNIINGPDEMLFMGLNAGADGGIGTTYNFMFDIIKLIYNNFMDGNIERARQKQTRANRIISELKKYRTIPATKVILEEMGFLVGDATFPMKKYKKKEKIKFYLR